MGAWKNRRATQLLISFVAGGLLWSAIDFAFHIVAGHCRCW